MHFPSAESDKRECFALKWDKLPTGSEKAACGARRIRGLGSGSCPESVR